MATGDKLVRLDGLKAAYDALKNRTDKADIDGYYEGMTVGDAEQLVATVGVQDKVPYNFRTSGGSIEIGDREVDKIIGGTVAWNQLVDENTEAVTLTSGHRYAACIGGVWSIGTSDGAAISVTGGTDQLFDLTMMFSATIAGYIATLETATPGAGVNWFRKLFPKPYYAYDAGSLQSVKTNAHKMVGFNAFDKDTMIKVGYIDDNGVVNENSSYKCTDFIRVVGGANYHIETEQTNGAWGAWYDADKNFISNCNYYTTSPLQTAPQNACFLRLTILTQTGGNPDTFCLNLSWDGERDGEYEPYEAHTYPLDSSLELRGIPKLDANNRLYYDGDEYESNGTVTRKYGVLTNQTGAIGDTITLTGAKSNLTEIICSEGRLADIGTISGVTLTLTKAISGASIVYELAESTTETADPYQNPQIVDDFGTEQYIDAGNRDVEIPVGHDTFYRQNLRAKLETAPNSPDSSGDYLMRRSNGQNSYVPYASPLPALPAEDGTYTLKCTVSGGTAALSWEADEA